MPERRNTMQIVVFQLGEEKYAIETSSVQSIDKIMDITKVPCASGQIKGLVNLRGSIITIVDPYVVLGIDEKERNPENLIIIETDSEILGIMVDKVAEVIELDSQTIKNVSISKDDDRDYIKGTVNMGDHLVTLIDVDALTGTK